MWQKIGDISWKFIFLIYNMKRKTNENKKKLTQEKFTLVLANCGFVTRPNGNLPFRFFNHVSRIKEVSLDLFETHFLDSLLLDHVVELKENT